MFVFAPPLKSCSDVVIVIVIACHNFPNMFFNNEKLMLQVIFDKDLPQAANAKIYILYANVNRNKIIITQKKRGKSDILQSDKVVVQAKSST